MKNLLLKFIILSVLILNGYCDAVSQNYDGAFYELFFGPQPSARAEAMGRSIASIPGDPNSYYYNPAGLAALNGMNINGGGTTAEHYDLYSNASFVFGGASWKFGKLGTLGLSVETFNTGEFELTYLNNNSDTISGKFHNYINNARLTVCREIIRDLFAGVNLNFFIPDYNFGYLPLENGNEGGPYLYLDLGVMKTFRFGTKDLKQDLSIGSSLINVNSAGYKYSDGQGVGKLPVIFRIGSSYNLLLNRTFNFLINAEYVDIFNSKYYDGIHMGFEFSLEPLLYLRAGYYTQNIQDKNVYGQFTYGAGINILLPGYFAGMETMPTFKIILDYSHLNLPSFNTDKQESNSSDLISITLTKWF